jgi:hypothetical protein
MNEGPHGRAKQTEPPRAAGRGPAHALFPGGGRMIAQPQTRILGSAIESLKWLEKDQSSGQEDCRTDDPAYQQSHFDVVAHAVCHALRTNSRH